jgi:zinc transport system permease protein
MLPCPPLADTHPLDRLIDAFTGLFEPGTFFSFSFNVRALLALLCVAFVCGSVGALVVGGRMAFFSDALAHCAFAGVSLGFLFFDLLLARAPSPAARQAAVWGLAGLGVLVGIAVGWAYRRGRGARDSLGVVVLFALALGLAGAGVGALFESLLSGPRPASEFWRWVTPVMIAFGGLIGAGIAYVRGRTALTSDTVIGVFFAGSIGLAAALRKIIKNRNLFSLEDFLFGDPLLVHAGDLVALGVLAALTAAFLVLTFNRLLLAGFNSSLALSRRVPLQRDGYLFVVLLALIVNLCLRSVGVLLINALLIVPAATAVNLSANLRQAFWLSVGLCLATCVGGQWLSWELGQGAGFEVGIPGTIVLLSVALFVGSLLVGGKVREWAGSRQPRGPRPEMEGDRANGAIV